MMDNLVLPISLSQIQWSNLYRNPIFFLLNVFSIIFYDTNALKFNIPSLLVGPNLMNHQHTLFPLARLSNGTKTLLCNFYHSIHLVPLEPCSINL